MKLLKQLKQLKLLALLALLALLCAVIQERSVPQEPPSIRESLHRTPESKLL